MVLWLLGISGAGKTTLGVPLRDKLRADGRACVMLDGDEVRSVFGGDLGFSKEDRMANIKRIILAAYALDQTDTVAIVCNISPFQELRDLCRAKIAGYHEIYLKKQLAVSMKNDVKQVYADSAGKTALVGVDIPFEEPVSPDLVIEVDTCTEQQALDKILEYIGGKA